MFSKHESFIQRFFSNFEADPSEFLKNLEEMFLHYFIHVRMFIVANTKLHNIVLAVATGVSIQCLP